MSEVRTPRWCFRALGISFVDDIHSLPDSVRLVVQFIAMFLMFGCWGILNWESWWIILLGLILCVGITNAYNFMDGINGMNGGYTLAVRKPPMKDTSYR